MRLSIFISVIFLFLPKCDRTQGIYSDITLLQIKSTFIIYTNTTACDGTSIYSLQRNSNIINKYNLSTNSFESSSTARTTSGTPTSTLNFDVKDFLSSAVRPGSTDIYIIFSSMANTGADDFAQAYLGIISDINSSPVEVENLGLLTQGDDDIAIDCWIIGRILC